MRQYRNHRCAVLSLQQCQRNPNHPGWMSRHATLSRYPGMRRRRTGITLLVHRPPHSIKHHDDEHTAFIYRPGRMSIKPTADGRHGPTESRPPSAVYRNCVKDMSAWQPQPPSPPATHTAMPPQSTGHLSDRQTDAQTDARGTIRAAAAGGSPPRTP